MPLGIEKEVCIHGDWTENLLQVVGFKFEEAENWGFRQCIILALLA